MLPPQILEAIALLWSDCNQSLALELKLAAATDIISLVRICSLLLRQDLMRDDMFFAVANDLVLLWVDDFDIDRAVFEFQEGDLTFVVLAVQASNALADLAFLIIGLVQSCEAQATRSCLKILCLNLIHTFDNELEFVLRRDIRGCLRTKWCTL